MNYFKTEICQNDDNTPLGILLGAKKKDMIIRRYPLISAGLVL